MVFDEFEWKKELISAKQEALDWQDKYMQQRVTNEKQSEKIVKQAARIAELEQLYNGVRSKENTRQIENVANAITRTFSGLKAYVDLQSDNVEKQIEQFRKG